MNLRPTTLALNVGVARKHLVPRFDNWSLVAIGTADVRAMVGDELAEAHLSNSAIRRHVHVLSSILEAAVADGRIARNPSSNVKLPPERSREMRFLEPPKILLLADAIRPEHYRPLILTAAYVGLRWGELAGLRVDPGP